MYLVENKYPGANITKLGDAFWWAIVISSVAYGDYYPVTTVGRLIAVFVMFSGIGISLSKHVFTTKIAAKDVKV